MNQVTMATQRITSADHIPALKPRQQWQAGWNLFCDRKPIGYCTNENERDGYNAAMRSCAYADGSAYLVSRGLAQ